ncbi:MAG TPA: TadE family protein [Candidatus Cybelea sp.]|nr:TadE family protein [Candidatus Cybelea sp.]
MIEFALLAPVLILLVVGVIEVGRFTYFGILAAHAAEAGAKYGAENLYTAQDQTGMKNAVLNDGQNLAWNVAATHTCSQNGSVATCLSGTPGPNMVYYVNVTVTATFHPLLYYPGVPTALPVTAYATMRVQNQ